MECQKEKSLKHSLTSKREEVIRRQTIELFIKKIRDVPIGTSLIFYFNFISFCRVNCSGRTSVCTSTTICANIRIDFINITFRNSFNGTFTNASTASNTIFTNYVSHCFKVLLINSTNYVLQK